MRDGREGAHVFVPHTLGCLRCISPEGSSVSVYSCLYVCARMCVCVRVFFCVHACMLRQQKQPVIQNFIAHMPTTLY